MKTKANQHNIKQTPLLPFSDKHVPSASVPEFPTWIAISAFVSTGFLVAIAIKRKTAVTVEGQSG